MSAPTRAAFLMLATLTTAQAETVIRQMWPGGMARTDTPNLVIRDDGVIYETTPGTTMQNFAGEEYRIIKRDQFSPTEIVPTYPGTGMQRFDQPAYQIDDE